MNKNAAMKGGGMLYAAIVSYLLFLPSQFCRIVWEEKSLPFSPRKLRCSPPSLSKSHRGVCIFRSRSEKHTSSSPLLICMFWFFLVCFLIHVP